jgi:hypothetical protein
VSSLFDTSTAHPSRRALLAGAAWAAPIVVMAAAAPLVAASPGTPVLVVNGDVHLSPSDFSTGQYSISLYSGTTPGYHINNEVTGYTITNATLTLWYPESGLTFTNMLSGSGWSNMVTTGTSRVEGGVTYYGYKSTNSGTYATTNGTTNLPGYQFDTTSTHTPQPGYVYISAAATSGTAPLAFDGGPFAKV